MNESRNFPIKNLQLSLNIAHMPKDQSINFLATSTRSIENRIFGVWVSLRLFFIDFLEPVIDVSLSSLQWLKPNMATSAATTFACQACSTSTRGLWLHRRSLLTVVVMLDNVVHCTHATVSFQTWQYLIASEELQQQLLTDHGQGAEIGAN